VSKKRRKRNKASKQQETRQYKPPSTGFKPHQSKADFTELKSYWITPPSDKMAEADIVEFIKESGAKFERKFRDSFQTLQDKIITIDPISLLSFFGFYDLTPSGEKDRELTENNPILQHHVEFLQSLVLRYQQEAFEFKPVLPVDFEVFRDLVQDVTEAFHMRRVAAEEPSLYTKKRKQFQVLEDIRLHTQAVRNWGHTRQITRIVTEIFAPLNDRVEQKLGVRITHLIAMCLKLVATVENRIKEHYCLLFPALQAKTLASAVEEYCNAFPELNLTPEKFMQSVKEQNLTLEDIPALVFQQGDLKLSNIYKFTLDEFVEAYPVAIEPDILRKVLKGWSFSFGDLSDRNAEHMFLGNPIWQKPLIYLDNDLFFWPVIQLFFSFCLELMEAVVQPNTELYIKYEERRGQFLEEEVERLFKIAFPSAHVYRGSKWHDPVTHKDFENDLLVLIDSYLVVVEAKSGKVAESARRGAPERLRTTINRLLIEPSVQAKRFADYLQDNPGTHQFPTRRGIVNEVNNSNVRQIIRLNITLDLLGFVHSHSPNLLQAGFIPPNIDIGITISLSHLEIIFDILEGTCEKLHYFGMRTQFEKTLDYYGDELDLLAFYIDTGFNIGVQEFESDSLSLLCLSKIFEPYLQREILGKDTPKPRRRLTNWWRDILSKIEQVQNPRWIELGCLLLNFSYDNQVEFQNEFKRIQNIVKRFWMIPEHSNICFLFSSPLQQHSAVAGVAYKQINRQQRNQMMKIVAYEAMKRGATDSAVVIGIDVDQHDYPYSILAYLDKSGEAIVP
jgi:hypothetical protein